MIRRVAAMVGKCAAACVSLTLFFSPPPSCAQDQPEDRYEIVSHRAALHLIPSSNLISVTDTITVHLTARPADGISIGLLRIYTLHSVTVNGRKAQPERRSDEVLLKQLPDDSLFDVTISYSGKFPERSEYSTYSSERAILREEECLPFGPKAYRSTRITIVAPKAWQSVTVGERVFADTVDDNARTVWEMREQIPLIGWICSGNYMVSSRQGRVVPICSYLFPEDSSSATPLMALADSVLAFDSERFSKYRFSQFNIVEVGDGIAGRAFLAIAQPSFIMVKKIAFTTDDPYNQAAAVIPHEIAHQWWPITVYVEEEDNALLSEGMCEYSAMLYRQFAGTPGKRDSLKTHPLLGSLISRAIKGEDLPLQMKADLRSLPTHYLKSAFVHNMLRREVGDSVFGLLYKEYAKRYALKRVSLKEFQSLAEELSGKNLSPFFDQWVKKKGVPRLKIYNVKSASAGGGWTTKGRVRMIGYEKFTALVDVGVVTKGGMTTQRVPIGTDQQGAYKNDVPFEIRTTQKPSRAILDPGGDILKIEKLPVKLGDLRDPSEGLFIVGTGGSDGYLLGIARDDSAQLDRGGWSVRITSDTAASLGDLQGGRVFLYGKASENRVVGNLLEKFQYKLSGDSIVLKSGALFDSSLALTQVIENPYRPQGMMIWIAPLSRKARPRLLPYDASWVVTREKEEISSGIWDLKDEELIVEIP